MKNTMTSNEIALEVEERGYDKLDFPNKQWLSKAYSDNLVALERQRYKEFVDKCIDEEIKRTEGMPKTKDSQHARVTVIRYLNDLKQKLGGSQ